MYAIKAKNLQICIIHEITTQKVTICKHAWKKYDYLESLLHKTNICKVREV